MRMLTLLAGLVWAVAPALAQTTVVTFDGGNQGWDGPQGFGGATTVAGAGGNPGANLHTVFQDFGIEFSTNTNTAWLGDYTLSSSVTLSFDIKVNVINFFGMDVSRPLLIDLRDLNTSGPYPWVSVWYKFTEMNAAANGAWQTYSITIPDTLAAALPPGWGGYGDEDAVGNPRLPANRSFSSVLASVEEVAISTYEPGFLYADAEFDVQVDNIRIAHTPRVVACGPADVGQQGGVPGADGVLDNNDFVVYIARFFASAPSADVGRQGGIPGSDGVFDNNDFIVYINQFFTGC